MTQQQFQESAVVSGPTVAASCASHLMTSLLLTLEATLSASNESSCV